MIRGIRSDRIPKRKLSYKISAAVSILRPAALVHIGNRLKIGHWLMMSCMPNVLPTQF